MLTLSCALFAGILKLLTIFLYPSISQLFNMPVNQSQHPSLHLLNVLRTFYINFNIIDARNMAYLPPLLFLLMSRHWLGFLL
ncbi:hypothetical protein B0H16DRAFT_1542994, partial [Mycena metata]